MPTYVVALREFPHAIAGSVEAAFGVWTGHAGITDCRWRFLGPTLIGNIVAGTALVPLLDHGPVVEPLKRGKNEGRAA